MISRYSNIQTWVPAYIQPFDLWQLARIDKRQKITSYRIIRATFGFHQRNRASTAQKAVEYGISDQEWKYGVTWNGIKPWGRTKPIINNKPPSMSPINIPGRSAFAQLRLGWQLIVGVPKRILAHYSAHLLSLSKEFARKSFRLFQVNKITE